MSYNRFLTFNMLLLSHLLLAGTDHCNKLLGNLADKQMLFVDCSTKNSVPVKICGRCLEQIQHMNTSYENLINDEECAKIYFDKDRINVVSSMQSVLNGLWSKAFCDDCSVDINQDFNNLSNSLKTCLSDNKGHECSACITQYQDINTFYNNLDTHNNGKVCYDMQDEMNRTRLQWSNGFKCCKRQFNMTLFLCASTFAVVLPIVFYLSVFLYGKRRELNHGVIDADAEQTAPLVQEDAAYSQDIQSTVVPASRGPSLNTSSINKKLVKNIMDSDSDSD